MNKSASLEALLFVAGKPLRIKTAAALLGMTVDEIKGLVVELKKKYNNKNSGIQIVDQGEEIQMVSHPALHGLVEQFVKKEITGELTRPQLETLAIIAYRGPITKPYIEEIRGINCSIIIRNLLIRGLIEENSDDAAQEPAYRVTVDFLRHLGFSQPFDLPQYAQLSQTQNHAQQTHE